MSRYKFVAKMLEGYRSVLEVGCADAFGSRIVGQATGKLTAIDFDAAAIRAAFPDFAFTALETGIGALCRDMAAMTVAARLAVRDHSR